MMRRGSAAPLPRTTDLIKVLSYSSASAVPPDFLFA
jgi:hypothetical protein